MTPQPDPSHQLPLLQLQTAILQQLQHLRQQLFNANAAAAFPPYIQVIHYLFTMMLPLAMQFL